MTTQNLMESISDILKEIRSPEGNTVLNESEQLDELSGKTLGSYIAKAHTDKNKKFDNEKKLDDSPKVKKLRDKLLDYSNSRQYTSSGDSKYRKQIDKLRVEIPAEKKKIDSDYPKSGAQGGYKRNRGIKTALEKLQSGKITKEDIEDFMQTEEFEQLDELSKQTLGSYIKKAGFDARDSGIRAGYSAARSSEAARDGHEFTSDSEAKRSNKNASKALKRTTGIVKAVNKLTKEDLTDIMESALEGNTLETEQMFNKLITIKLEECVEQLKMNIAEQIFGEAKIIDTENAEELTRKVKAKAGNQDPMPKSE